MCAIRFKARMIACALLASAIVLVAAGALSFSPQLGSLPVSSPSLMPEPSQTPASMPAASVSSMFDVDLVYAYMGPNYIPPHEHGHFGWDVRTYPGGTNYPGLVILEYTYRGDPFDEAYEIVFEGYSCEFRSDTGLAVTCKAYVATNFNRSEPYPDLPGMLPSEEAMSINVRLNLVVGDSFTVGSGTGLLTSIDDLALWENGTPETITLTVRREGWWTSKAEPLATVSTLRNPLADEVLMQVQLVAFGDGFLYNKIVPENAIAGMDPFNPPV